MDDVRVVRVDLPTPDAAVVERLGGVVVLVDRRVSSADLARLVELALARSGLGR